MKAIACNDALPIDHPQALFELDLPEPEIGARDLLVEVRAIAVNPVDCKVRRNQALVCGQPRVLGWDCSGVVRRVGSQVELFQEGDEVFYAGALNRPGCNSQLHCVDERLVGHKPKSLSFAEAAALPLTSITAWELLFDRLKLTSQGTAAGRLLVVGAAGGVGSILLQLAQALTQAQVIGTAGRAKSRAWLAELGLKHCIDHHQPLAEQLTALGFETVDYVASLTHSAEHFAQLAQVLAPQGQFALIDDPGPLDIGLLKRKSISLHWEFMFTRSLYATADQIKQHLLLEQVAALVDQGRLRTTLKEHFGVISAANLRRAHALLEAQQGLGKIVLEGFH